VHRQVLKKRFGDYRDQDSTHKVRHALLIAELGVFLSPDKQHLLHVLAHFSIPEQVVFLQRSGHVLVDRVFKLFVSGSHVFLIGG